MKCSGCPHEQHIGRQCAVVKFITPDGVDFLCSCRRLASLQPPTGWASKGEGDG